MSGKFKNIFLTGEPGVGKTAIILKVLADLAFKAGGFYTQEIKSGKTCKGYDLVTLDGKQGIVAHINHKSTYKVGKYGVDLSVLNEVAVPALKRSLENDDILVIDEIGKMECFSLEFRDMAVRCLDSSKPVLGTIQNFASPFINLITNRDDIVRITVTEQNRDQLVSKIIELFKHLMPSKAVKKTRR